jgi:hypothetical protein
MRAMSRYIGRGRRYIVRQTSRYRRSWTASLAALRGLR